ncbi:hypothetical protein GUG94_23430, partial [Xanthomonas citri pv. citri]|nr:hypothetical protein [Xanthomonas citri pv. citri]
YSQVSCIHLHRNVPVNAAGTLIDFPRAAGGPNTLPQLTAPLPDVTSTKPYRRRCRGSPVSQVGTILTPVAFRG